MYRIDTYAKNGNWIEAFIGSLKECFDWLESITYQWDEVRIIDAIPVERKASPSEGE